MFRLDAAKRARARLLNRVHARLAARAKPATAFVSQPEPRTVGSFARGRQLTAGNLLFAGHLVEAPGAIIWDISPPDDAFVEEIHGFAWLDDMASVGEPETRRIAQAWLFAWIARYGNGTGPGWTPELAGRRVMRWLHHAIFVLGGCTPDQSRAFFRSIAQQTIFLNRRWHSSTPGLPRFEALTGLISAGLSLQGMESQADPAIRALGLECARQITEAGGIPTRNPEELMEVCTLLIWARDALHDAGRTPEMTHLEAIGRIVPTLRALRHADGGLARFHGGGRGADGRLDTALAASGVKAQRAQDLAMGYARLSGGRTSIVIDAAAPPTGLASFNAHASTLAFELTSGRRPLIVNCGSGASFGEDWRRAGRATPSHSTLCLDGFSSARLGERSRVGPVERELLEDVPRGVPTEISRMSDGMRFEGGHDGYLRTHGFTHARILELTFDGRGMVGEDLLVALSAADKARFNEKLDGSRLAGVPFDIRFHLHPEVDADIDMNGAAVSMALRSGEIWVFRLDAAGCELRLEASVYLEKGRLRPRATKQIVLSGRAMEYATRVRWSLAKAQDTAIAVRDLVQDDADVMN
ncbi:heparinase II/III family protein [Marivita sp. GX14005]|uniref:heparinase II/III family protein n=1 Tax=Marivita sp. GX14005 TaxID=2942276 RepID=UPI0020189BB0|nr:heparinase II/III family protein [Marivita sp. GX14005]MCL3881398.1 heparinase II/III family protein [Marivita sp. GX14005]